MHLLNHSHTAVILFLVILATKVPNITHASRSPFLSSLPQRKRCTQWIPKIRFNRRSLLDQKIHEDRGATESQIIHTAFVTTVFPPHCIKINKHIPEVVLLMRGGSLFMNDKSIIYIKLRNVLRSIVEIGERNVPAATKVIKKSVNIFEKLSGMELLSKEDEIKKKCKKKKKNDDSVREKEQSVVSRKSKTKTNYKKKPNYKKCENVVSSKKRGKSCTSATPQQPSSSAAKNHLSTPLKATSANYRIQRELKQFVSSPPSNLSVRVSKNIRVWIIIMTFPENTVYHGESYRLRVQFPNDYPTSPPSVYFLKPTPRHEHVYTNGDICLSLLGKDWRPTMTAQSIAMSILSILSGAQRKALPMDNVRHSGNKPGGAQDDWVYHDDNC